HHEIPPYPFTTLFRSELTCFDEWFLGWMLWYLPYLACTSSPDRPTRSKAGSTQAKVGATLAVPGGLPSAATPLTTLPRTRPGTRNPGAIPAPLLLPITTL